MKLSQLTTNAKALEQQLLDPLFRKQWEQTTLARTVAVAVSSYRSQRGLTQAALAERLGSTQPGVARLERGEHNPSLETLVKLSASLVFHFKIDITPTAAKSRPTSERARETAAVALRANEEVTISLAVDG